MGVERVECVPNFSEGRDERVLAALVRAAESVPAARVLDLHRDGWHHRSVLTLAGEPGAVAEAAFRSVQAAVRLIDLRRHTGEHPRIGAADVVPFVPLEGADMARCVELAEATGRRIADQLGVPVYLYGEAARRPERRALVSIRRGGFEGLSRAIRSDRTRAPDLGPPRLHPTAGATAVGARPVLVAYNVLLDTDRVEVAREIAGEIRASSGGLPAVQALGFLVEGRAQVSTNLRDVDRTPPAAVFDAVRERARAREVEVAASEIVGLVPERALPPDPAARLRLREPVEPHVLERRLAEELGGSGRDRG